MGSKGVRRGFVFVLTFLSAAYWDGCGVSRHGSILLGLPHRSDGHGKGLGLEIAFC